MSKTKTDELFSGALDEVRAVLEAGVAREVDALTLPEPRCPEAHDGIRDNCQEPAGRHTGRHAGLGSRSSFRSAGAISTIGFNSFTLTTSHGSSPTSSRGRQPHPLPS